jgi:hypothetical protein
LEYLVENPNAEDTAEGMSKKWLWIGFDRSNVTLVKDAAELVAADLALETRGKRSRLLEDQSSKTKKAPRFTEPV